MDVLTRIEMLFAQHGDGIYEGRRAEAVTAIEHALQCAQLAEWAMAPAEQVAAAFLHDIGHFIDASPDTDAIDDVHELRALELLRGAFGPAVLEPIRLHVAAKRYLVAVDAGYLKSLSPASLHTLQLQGGAMSTDELRMFEDSPFSDEALALRRWDDLAKLPGRSTPSLAHYLTLLDELLLSSRPAERIVIGAFDV